MKNKLWLTLITYLAYCIDKELYKAIDYLKEQVKVLIEQQEKQGKRILLTNNQRMRISAKAKKLSRRMLEKCTVLFTVDTIIGWYNKLIAQKYDGTHNRGKVGRPQITPEIVDLVLCKYYLHVRISLKSLMLSGYLELLPQKFAKAPQKLPQNQRFDLTQKIKAFAIHVLAKAYVNGRYRT